MAVPTPARVIILKLSANGREFELSRTPKHTTAPAPPSCVLIELALKPRVIFLAPFNERNIF